MAAALVAKIIKTLKTIAIASGVLIALTASLPLAVTLNGQNLTQSSGGGVLVVLTAQFSI